jgi:hypothetical protein
MITAAFAFLLVAPRAETITYHGPVDRLEVVLADLSKQTGENLQPGVGLGDLPVFLRCDDRPAAEVYTQLASLVNGRWERDSRAYRLIRDPRDIAKERREDEKANSEIVAAALAKKRAEVEKLEPFSEATAEKLVKQLVAMTKEVQRNPDGFEDFERAESLDDQGPINRAFSRLLATLNPAMVASLPPGIKVVFSNQPKPSQQPLPAGFAPLLERAFQEQSLFSNAAQKLGVKAPQVDGVEYRFSSLFAQTKSTNQIDRVWFSLAFKPGVAIYAELKILDKKGSPWIDQATSVPLGNSEAATEVLTKDYSKSNLDPVVNFDPARKQIIDRFAVSTDLSKSTVRSTPPLQGPFRELALNIDQFEPTQYLVTDVIDQATPPGPVAAIIDDQLIFITCFLKKTLPLMTAKKSLRALCQVSTDGGWTQVRPPLMGQFMRDRLSRKFQAEVIRLSADVNTPTIEQQARIAFLSGNQENDVLTWFFSQRVKGQFQFLGDPEQSYARLYGCLTDSQRRVAAGDRLSMGNLEPSQLDILDKIIYAPYFSPTLAATNSGATGATSGTELINSFAFYNGVGSEATELLPNGFLPTSAILTSESSDTVVMPVTPAGSLGVLQAQNAKEFARNQYYRSRPDVFTFIDRTEPVPTSFRYAKRRKLKITLQIQPGISTSGTISENRLVNSNAVRYSGLPAEFRAEVDAITAQLKERHKNAKPGQYGGAGTGSKIPPN